MSSEGTTRPRAKLMKSNVEKSQTYSWIRTPSEDGRVTYVAVTSLTTGHIQQIGLIVVDGTGSGVCDATWRTGEKNVSKQFTVGTDCLGARNFIDGIANRLPILPPE